MYVDRDRERERDIETGIDIDIEVEIGIQIEIEIGIGIWNIYMYTCSQVYTDTPIHVYAYTQICPCTYVDGHLLSDIREPRKMATYGRSTRNLTLRQPQDVPRLALLLLLILRKLRIGRALGLGGRRHVSVF